MPGSERRTSRRFIMKVPLRFRLAELSAMAERKAASMNICTHGVYFSTEEKLPEGQLVQVHLKMPREIVGDDVSEWCFTGRVAHVESLGPINGKSGVGVQFIYYEAPPAII